jgi:phosphatidate cytidylyltransferase
MDPDIKLLLAGVLGVLLAASLIGFSLSRTVKSPEACAAVANLNARTRSWWVMVAVFAVTLALGKITTVVLFAVISFLALREFITLNATRPSDHAPLFWVFFIILPIQYFLVGIEWYGMFGIFIPVYAFIFIPVRKVLAGDATGFLETTAKIQWGLLVCVYFVSHIPMLLSLPLRDFEGQNAKLLFFLVIVVQASDVLQYVWGKTCGKHRIAPAISPGKTWEGFIGGVASATLLGALLWWATPFRPHQAALMALMLCLAGFAGGLVMSAIKRDLGAKDWGTAIAGHGGFMDRIDSLCFAAPLFFHLCGFYFGTGMDPKPPEWILQWLGK